MTADSTTAGELNREARMVLRRLAAPDARLTEVSSGKWTAETGRSRRNSGQTVEGAVVEALVSRGWLIREPTGDYRISVAGERLLGGAKASTEEAFGGQHRLVRRQTRPSRGGSNKPVLNEAESPLGWLRSRRDKAGEPLISESQYEAGERLRVDFTIAQLSPRITLSWDACATPGSNGRSGRRPDSLDVSETALAAKQRFMRALDAVGPELSGILVEVCCVSRGLEAAERSLGWPQRSAKLVLQIALTRLARHYGLIQVRADPKRPPYIKHWGVDDYRPKVGPAARDGGSGGDQA